MQKILVILGPTASGKSALAVKLAQKFNGEIISADSRQVYKGLTIGTGKITKKEMSGIRHHLLDVADPKNKKVFTVQNFKDQAEKTIQDILKRKKLPIICGGTGFYIQSIVDNILLPEVPVNKKLRKSLEKKSPRDLFLMLAELDIRRAAYIDFNNKVRVIRAIEIATYLGRVPELTKAPNYESLQIGIKIEDSILKKRIHTRLLARIKAGMMREAKKLHKAGLTWKRMEELGLEYKYLALYLQNKKNLNNAQNKKEFIEKLNTEIWHYAKRQMTWFKKDSRIKWFNLKEIKKIEKIEKEVKKFLS